MFTAVTNTEPTIIIQRLNTSQSVVRFLCTSAGKTGNHHGGCASHHAHLNESSRALDRMPCNSLPIILNQVLTLDSREVCSRIG